VRNIKPSGDGFQHGTGDDFMVERLNKLTTVDDGHWLVLANIST
jgi:hypothetical protein